MTTRELAATPEALNKILDRRPVLWVGAGASVAAGYPGTWQLMQAMADGADDPIDLNQTFEQVADAFVASMRSSALSDLLQAQFGGSRALTDLHRAVARRVGARDIAALVTTNYDDLLERSLGEAELRYVKQSLQENDVVIDPHADVRLLKLHGSRENWDETILSGESYSRFEDLYPFLGQQLDQLLKQQNVLFVGCSLQDPRLVHWLEGLDEPERQRLKPWRALMTRNAWDNALAAHDILGQTETLRPLILDDHDHLPRLWLEASPPPKPVAAESEMALTFRVTGSGIKADFGGNLWQPSNPLDDDELSKMVELLRKDGTKPLPTDDHGVISLAIGSVAAALRQLARTIGERLWQAVWTADVKERLLAATRAGRSGVPAFLRLRVAVEDGNGQADREQLANRLLALPWELLYLDDAFPVQEHTLDIVREAVVPGMPDLQEPDTPLTVAVTVAAPEGAVPLHYEEEMFRLWRAVGSADEGRLVEAELGTLEDLAQTVERHGPPVVHFSGHGRPGVLLFEDERTQQQLVEVDELTRKLRAGGNLPRLIYLSACDGATAGGAPMEPEEGQRMVDAAATEATSPSTAATLHRGGFSQVVAYFGPVGDAQATRTAATFYRYLASGLTARAALRKVRQLASEPFGERPGGVPDRVYSLGWAQLVLYHRGPDLPTAVSAPAPSHPLSEGPLRRDTERIDRAGGSVRAHSGVEGVQQLRFGFIGRRRPRARAIQRWRRGGRVLVVVGLGGLGKTALCTELLRALGDGQAVVALDGRHAGAQPDPLAALWRELLAITRDGAFAEIQARVEEEGLQGRHLADAALKLAELRHGLMLYLDDAESLQEDLEGGGHLGVWRSDDLREFWHELASRAKPEGPLTVVASSRYLPEGTPDGGHLDLAPMSKWEIVRLMRWMPTLSHVPHEDRDWLADKIDGHPRTVEYLEILAAAAVRRLSDGGASLDEQPFQGNWRQDVLQPIVDEVGDLLEADLLLRHVWQALGADAQEHLGRCTVLTAPAPREVIRLLAADEDQSDLLVSSGLLSPFRVGDATWWAPHRLVSETVAGRWDGETAEAHRIVGGWFQKNFEKHSGMASAQRAVEHFCRAGDGDTVFPTAQKLILGLRGAGRYREGLEWVERLVGGGVSGSQKGLSLMYLAQLRRYSGALLAESIELLHQALDLMDASGKGWVLHELGDSYQTMGQLIKASEFLQRAVSAKESAFGEESEDVSTSLHALAYVLQAQGNLAGARDRLERSLEISKRVLGTEEHVSIAASLHSLAGVLKAQGDLVGARERLERSLEIKARVFGTEDHPDVAVSLQALGTVFFVQGDLEGAWERLERSLSIWEQVLGKEDHPEVARTLHSMAGVLKAQGDLVGARERLERSLEIQARVFGSEDHPDVASSLHALADVLKAQGDLVGARERLERSLEIKEKIYGTRDHYLSAISEVDLAMVLLQLGEVEEAKKGVALLMHAFQVFRQQLGDEHPYTRQLARLFQQFQEGHEDDS